MTEELSECGVQIQIQLNVGGGENSTIASQNFPSEELIPATWIQHDLASSQIVSFQLQHIVFLGKIMGEITQQFGCHSIWFLLLCRRLLLKVAIMVLLRVAIALTVVPREVFSWEEWNLKLAANYTTVSSLFNNRLMMMMSAVIVSYKWITL